MSIGTSSLAARVTRNVKELAFSGMPMFRSACSVTIAGHAPSAVTDIVLLVYRGDTLVAQCVAFTGSTTSATGTLDLNTDELAAVFEDDDEGADRSLEYKLWDATAQELIAVGNWYVRNVKATYAEDTETTPTASVSSAGSLAYEMVDGNMCFVLKGPDGTVFRVWQPPGV